MFCHVRPNIPTEIRLVLLLSLSRLILSSVFFPSSQFRLRGFSAKARFTWNETAPWTWHASFAGACREREWAWPHPKRAWRKVGCFGTRTERWEMLTWQSAGKMPHQTNKALSISNEFTRKQKTKIENEKKKLSSSSSTCLCFARRLAEKKSFSLSLVLLRGGGGEKVSIRWGRRRRLYEGCLRARQSDTYVTRTASTKCLATFFLYLWEMAEKELLFFCTVINRLRCQLH